MRTVVVAPDKFKGTLTAAEAADAIAAGWRRSRPDDVIHLAPMADGGDGTADVVARAHPGSEWRAARCVDAVGAEHDVSYPILPDGTAVLELAAACGLAQLGAPAPMTAHTAGLGQVLADAVARGARRAIVGLGGSASTDGGAGLVLALGGRLRDAEGAELRPGDDLLRVHSADLTDLIAPPPDGVEVLVDTTATLVGPSGAPRVFAPQKGADAAQVRQLEAALAQLASVLGGEPDAAGAGAAGGTAYGLCTAWPARIVPGAARIGELIGLSELIAAADLVITGEGRYDATSLTGKASGHVLDLAGAAGVPVLVLAGSVGDGLLARDLSALAGSAEESRRHPDLWLQEAARLAAAELD